MSYIKSFLFYCLTIFFANYLLPGVDVVNQTKLPHIGGDLILALGLGVLNFLIGLFVQFRNKSFSFIRVAIVTLILNFGVYAILKLLPLGVFTTSVEGYLLVAGVVSIGSGTLTYIQGKRRSSKKEEPHHPEIHHHHHSEEE